MDKIMLTPTPMPKRIDKIVNAKSKKRRLNMRHMLALAVIVISIMVTPFLVIAAIAERGHIAFGGEFMFIPLGFVVAMIIMSVASIPDRCSGNKRTKNNA